MWAELFIVGLRSLVRCRAQIESFLPNLSIQIQQEYI